MIEIAHEMLHQGRLASCRDFPGELHALEETGSRISGMHYPLLPFFPNGEAYATMPEEWSLAPEFMELWEVIERINKKIGQKGDIPPWLAEM